MPPYTYVGGVNHCRSHGGLAKFRDSMYMYHKGEILAVIGRKTFF